MGRPCEDLPWKEITCPGPPRSSLRYPLSQPRSPRLARSASPAARELYTGAELAVKQKGLRKTAPCPSWVNSTSLIRERASSRRLIFT